MGHPAIRIDELLKLDRKIDQLLVDVHSAAHTACNVVADQRDSVGSDLARVFGRLQAMCRELVEARRCLRGKQA